MKFVVPRSRCRSCLSVGLVQSRIALILLMSGLTPDLVNVSPK